MRLSLLVVLGLGLAIGLGLVACFDGPAPPALTGDGGLFGGGDLASTDLAGADFAAGPDLSPQCQTACDCTPGQRCDSSGMCTAAGNAVYCCTSSTCPTGELCQQRNGDVNQCGQNPDASVRLVDGGTGMCGTQRCTQGAAGDLLCKLACGSVSATCVMTGGMEHCAP
jgi:hypothetical protein